MFFFFCIFNDMEKTSKPKTEEYDFIKDFFVGMDYEKSIRKHIVKPLLSMVYNELFPYVCFFTSILILCIFLLVFVAFLLVFMR